jgi:hypothetical protein
MSLSSLIVQREIASIREVEEALARQVLYGGDFVTNLFEVSRIEESALMPAVAESYGLQAAPTGELPTVPRDAVMLIAPEVVAERCFAPLEIGKALVVAVAEPLSADAEQELTFALALPLEQRIAPLFRIRQALARDYGVPLDKRTARLITKVIHKGPRIASTFPPPLESSPHHRPPPRPPSIAAPPPAKAATRASKKPAPTGPQGTFVREGEGSPLRPMRRRRGPLTADLAKAELEASAERDVIFDILFEFARQFFDYTALFGVQGDLAEGRDAFGEGTPREKVVRIGVPLDLTNLLATAREQKKLLRARPQTDGLDPVLMSDLGRDGKTECVVFPVIVRNRVVALLLGDGGSSGIDDIGVAQVEQLVESAAGAFERVIVRRKLKGSEAKAEGGVASAKKKAADSVPPPTQISSPPIHGSAPGSDRPAAEELAPPIRELLLEPMSNVATTTRQPTATAALMGADPERDDRPPPPNLLRVRRPSGAPIPREEPELPGMAGAPSKIPAAASAPPGPQRTRSQSLKRAEAPRFDFGAPAVPNVVTESAWSGIGTSDDNPLERQLAAQLETRAKPKPSDPPPRTTRDPEGGAWGATAGARDREPSSPPQPWATATMTSARGDEVPLSPRAISPPPMPAVSVSITDRSPPSIDAVIAAEKRPVITDEPVRPMYNLRTTLASGSPLMPEREQKVDENLGAIKPLVVVTPDREMTPVSLDSLGNVVDPDATPIAPAVFDPDMQPTPIAGSVAPISPPESRRSNPEPILSLAQRKGAPPFVPAEPRPMPMSEQQVSVAPHKPPSSRSDYSRVLPSVIVDVSSEYVTLVERVVTGPDEEAETELLRAGGYAMPAIMTRFPGPIAIETERLDSGALPRVADCGPVIRLVASQRRTALPFVLSHVEGPDLEKRFWATYLLTELVYPDAIDAAVSRTFDEEPRIRRVARAAARALAEAHPQAVVERLGEIANTQSEIRRVQAIEALGEAREPLAVPILLPLLEDHLEGVVTATRAALVLITQQDFFRDTDKWINWWADNRQRHRLEWLIDSLMHEQRGLRSSASEELRSITKEYFGYYDDLPKRERERAQARYREWWENIGRVRFSRASTRST